VSADFARQLERELNELRKDKERLDWCEKHLIAIVDGGGAWKIEFGSICEPQQLDYQDDIRTAIDQAKNK
jgi:hypothetical protein